MPPTGLQPAWMHSDVAAPGLLCPVFTLPREAASRRESGAEECEEHVAEMIARFRERQGASHRTGVEPRPAAALNIEASDSEAPGKQAEVGALCLVPTVANEREAAPMGFKEIARKFSMQTSPTLASAPNPVASSLPDIDHSSVQPAKSPRVLSAKSSSAGTKQSSLMLQPGVVQVGHAVVPPLNLGLLGSSFDAQVGPRLDSPGCLTVESGLRSERPIVPALKLSKLTGGGETPTQDWSCSEIIGTTLRSQALSPLLSTRGTSWTARESASPPPWEGVTLTQGGKAMTPRWEKGGVPLLTPRDKAISLQRWVATKVLQGAVRRAMCQFRHNREMERIRDERLKNESALQLQARTRRTLKAADMWRLAMQDVEALIIARWDEQTSATAVDQMSSLQDNPLWACLRMESRIKAQKAFEECLEYEVFCRQLPRHAMSLAGAQFRLRVASAEMLAACAQRLLISKGPKKQQKQRPSDREMQRKDAQHSSATDPFIRTESENVSFLSARNIPSLLPEQILPPLSSEYHFSTSPSCDSAVDLCRANIASALDLCRANIVSALDEKSVNAVSWAVRPAPNSASSLFSVPDPAPLGSSESSSTSSTLDIDPRGLTHAPVAANQASNPTPDGLLDRGLRSIFGPNFLKEISANLSGEHLNGVTEKSTDRKGNTALHMAAWRGDKHACLWLIRHGADVLARNEDGRVPLDFALHSESFDCAEVLKHAAGGTSVLPEWMLPQKDVPSNAFATVSPTLTDNTDWSRAVTKQGSFKLSPRSQDKTHSASDASTSVSEQSLTPTDTGTGDERRLSVAAFAGRALDAADHGPIVTQFPGNGFRNKSDQSVCFRESRKDIAAHLDSMTASGPEFESDVMKMDGRAFNPCCKVPYQGDLKSHENHPSSHHLSAAPRRHGGVDKSHGQNCQPRTLFTPTRRVHQVAPPLLIESKMSARQNAAGSGRAPVQVLQDSPMQAPNHHAMHRNNPRPLVVPVPSCQQAHLNLDEDTSWAGLMC